MGKDYPSVMSFYQFALHLANTRENCDTENEENGINSDLDIMQSIPAASTAKG